MRILVVEDDPLHLDSAIKTLGDAGVEILTATDARTGLRNLESLPDGVITDIFMPLVSGNQRYGSDNEPCGLAIALRAEQIGIPFVLCTAGYHHGARYQWINELADVRNWPLVDSSIFGGTADSGESSEKDWAEALRQLKELIDHHYVPGRGLRLPN